MDQPAINQRLKFLVETLAESARAFSEIIGDSPTNTHNYISGGRRPNPEFLEKVVLRFRTINAHWLLTGEGEPFTLGAPTTPAIYKLQTQNQKKNKGAIFNNQGPASYTALANCEKDLKSLQEKYDLLVSQLEDKERVIRLYETQRPNP